MSQTNPGPIRLLLVDDEAVIRIAAGKTLQSVGYQIEEAASADEAMVLIRRNGLPHLALIDIVMPERSGLELCEEILAFCDLPIIMLSSVSETETVVESIERYAEDYITKPFKPAELIARVARVLRRIPDLSYASRPRLRVDEHLELDLANQRVVFDGETVTLTPTESKLLHILLRSAGSPVSSRFLCARLWPHDDVFEDSLRVQIHRLRKKVESDPRNPIYLETVRGIGYRFASLQG